MLVPVGLLAALGVLLALGLLERRARDAAWRDIPIRIHVNGTRGKSTVTRLIWSALREAGIPPVAKTTGTSPRLLLPDGTEHAIVRRAPPTIREQLALLRVARRHRARAVVVECMALDPELQWIAEHGMLRSTIGVVTNVRPDHTEVMGRDHATIAATLANTTPRRGVLVLGDAAAADVFQHRARQLGSQVISVADDHARDGWLAENERIALAVLRHLHVPDAVAARGFAKVPPDPGAVASGPLRTPGARWIDATAANDPVSLGRLMQEHARTPDGCDDVGRAGAALVIYNHRDDRGPRLACFVAHPGVVREAATLVVTGARPAWTLWRQVRRRREGRRTLFIPVGALAP